MPESRPGNILLLIFLCISSYMQFIYTFLVVKRLKQSVATIQEKQNHSTSVFQVIFSTLDTLLGKFKPLKSFGIELNLLTISLIRSNFGKPSLYFNRQCSSPCAPWSSYYLFPSAGSILLLVER